MQVYNQINPVNNYIDLYSQISNIIYKNYNPENKLFNTNKIFLELKDNLDKIIQNKKNKIKKNRIKYDSSGVIHLEIISNDTFLKLKLNNNNYILDHNQILYQSVIIPKWLIIIMSTIFILLILNSIFTQHLF